MLGTSADPDAIIEVTNAYDTAGRLDSVTYKRVPGAATPPAAQTFFYDYEPNSYGLVKTVTGPKLTTQNTWEGHRDLLSVKENDAGMTQVSDYYYELNDLGQRTAAEIHSGAGGLLTWEWGYDAKGQVVKADGSSGGGTADDRFYDYDQIGNRKQSRNGTFTSTGGSATDYFADTAATIVGASGLNQYKGIKTGGVTRNPVYDDDGNLTDDGTAWQYKWDGENRMIKATPKTPGVKIGYRYDHLGRLSARMTYTWGDLQLGTYRYVYNGWNRIEYVNSSLIREEYVWGLDLSGAEQGAGGVGGMLLWARTVDTGANWSTFYPAYDGNGNVTELVDSSGTVAAHWEYDPFGNTTKQVPASSTWSDPVVQFPYRFSTKWHDGNTGLYYYGHRFYDPLTGRWPSRDPIGERGGVNTLNFVGNAPLNLIDVLGLAQIVTDMNGGYTYWIPSDCCCEAPTYWKTSNAVKPSSLTTKGETAESPYSSDDVYPTEGPYKDNADSYGPNDILKTDDSARGRWLHGGGSGCPDPSANRQGWYPTSGCTRFQNDDIQNLVDKVRDHKKKNKGEDAKVPFDRGYYPDGGVPAPYQDCMSTHNSAECKKKRGDTSESGSRAQAVNAYDPSQINYAQDKGVVNRRGTWLPPDDPNWSNR